MDIDEMMQDPDFTAAMGRTFDLGNLGVIAPHKAKYYDRYDIDWLIDSVEHGTEFNKEWLR